MAETDYWILMSKVTSPPSPKVILDIRWYNSILLILIANRCWKKCFTELHSFPYFLLNI